MDNFLKTFQVFYKNPNERLVHKLASDADNSVEDVWFFITIATQVQVLRTSQGQIFFRQVDQR